MATIKNLVARANAWPAVATLFIGLMLGMAGGMWFYATFLDKPETVTNMEIGKQKVSGAGNTSTFDNQPNTEVNKKKRVRLFGGKNKEE